MRGRSDAPRKKLRPSPNFTFVPLAVGNPFLARSPSTITSLPIGKSVFRRPRRTSAFGAPASIAQLTTLPSGPVTSMCSHP